ncbi:MAG: hypothetical protein U5N53_02715 [Mycobacterium sp.]|nr:hypothetical protein [Mycobacterium sp.]
MRVAAAACLVSSGLLVGGASGAVALAEPDSSGDAAGTGTAGRGSDETAGQSRRNAPRGVETVTRAGPGSPGPRSSGSPARTAGLPTRSADTAESDPSKLAEAEVEAGEAPPGVAPGEPDDGAPTAEADDTGDARADDEEADDDEEDDECGWGWWPLPPDSDPSAPNGGDGYGGGAPSTAQPPAGRPGAPPGLDVPPPRELLPESPVLPVVPDPQEPLPGLVAPAAMPVLSMPVIVLPPPVPGLGGGGGAGPRAQAPGSPARPPAPSRTTPAERPAAPRNDAVVPASYRAGYGEYLRTAGMPQVIAVAVPGATVIMLLTGVGGLIGYRQARAGLAVRARGSARFSG